jgi:hypothetical protein
MDERQFRTLFWGSHSSHVASEFSLLFKKHSNLLVVAGLAVAVTVGTGVDCIAVLKSTPVPNSNSGAAD